MPRFSVIVPVHNVEAFVREALESVLDQSYADFELIVVDDHSPDGCGAIIDTYAALDPRVSAVHLPENVGLGRARNAGLALATGEYVIFLDSDDTLTPGTLRAITERLRATDSPDVLVFDYARTHDDGRVVRNQLAGLLRHDGPASFALADRPKLINLLPVSWNKAYRRAFIEDTGLTFPPGFYEDAPWTYPVLVSARTLAVLDRECVHYRQRTGSILSTTSRRHLDLLDQYDRVFAFLDGDACHERWRPLLYRRMARHYGHLVADRRRLPREARTEFFRRAADSMSRHHAPGAAPALGVRLRQLLMRRGARRTYWALSAAGALRARAATTARRTGAAPLRTTPRTAAPTLPVPPCGCPPRAPRTHPAARASTS
ncbi:glycosyltransferase family 2 protein [Streptomyces sp. NPDC101733]|uniref:glycosyltransferase family 2 protein n=1 Tax=unclassified Streptomyces TaxID=2593676 RepID=UPI0037F6BEF9